MLGVPSALDVDGVGHRGDLGEVLGAELEVGRAEVLLEALGKAELTHEKRNNKVRALP